MLFNPLFFLVTVFLGAFYSFAVPIGPQYDFDLEVRDDWMVRRGTDIYRAPATAAPGITRHSELDVRAPAGKEAFSTNVQYARDDDLSLESRGIGDWFKGVGDKIKGGLQKAGGWLKDNWQSVAGVAMKFIP